MRIHLIAVGRKMPRWVEEGYGEFAKRLPPECALDLIAVDAPRGRKAADGVRRVAAECEQLRAAVPKGARVVALDEHGRPWTTRQLARKIQEWLQGGRDVALLVGGPDGLSPACRDAAHEQWSLSPLTLPHMLCRVLIAEQLYRAWSLLHGHPYHRGE
jgi:23S rRNA (pseudouridine1915-N3)-methyltransferase